MAMESKSSEDYMHQYVTYRCDERDLLEGLFPGYKWPYWSLNSLCAETASVAPSLGKEQRESIIDSFEKSMNARKEHSVLFGDAPPQSRRRHGQISKLLEILIGLIKAAALPEAETVKETLLQQAEALDNVSFSEATFLRFLEDIERLVGRAVALWPRAAAGDLRLSTASMLTSTFLCKIKALMKAESLLNESWFGPGGLVVVYKSDSFPFWNELQLCALQIGDLASEMRRPFDESKLQEQYAPLVMKMLVEGSEAEQKNGSPIDLSAAIAACFVDRCKTLDLDLDKLRTSVTTQISDLTKLLQTLINHFRHKAGNFLDIALFIPKFQIWANRCGDANSLGEMMSWLEPNIVHGRRYFTNESHTLQLFAYICELVRIRKTKLPAALEALFNDPRVAPFLFSDGRPKTPDACLQGIEKSLSASANTESSRIYEEKDKLTLTEQISWSDGVVTDDMVQQLDGKTLEQCLHWELDWPNPIGIEEALIGAAKSISKHDSMDHLALLHYMKEVVLRIRELWKELLDAFIKQWAPEVRKEGPEGA